MGSRGEVPCQGVGDEIPKRNPCAERKDKRESERDRSLPRPVGETGRRSVGNRKERLRDYASSPDDKATITILIHFDRISAPSQQATRCAGPRRMRGNLDFPLHPSGLPYPFQTLGEV